MISFSKNSLIALLIIISSVIVLVILVFSKDTNQKVLSESLSEVKISPLPSPFESPSSIPSVRPTATATPLLKLSKVEYTIALYGDSMIDTMGEHLEYLQKSLKAKYPQTNFKMYNFGIGGQNVAQGLARFNEAFSYQTRNYPAIAQINADVIVIGSFAYNPFPNHDKNRHWSTLSQLVADAKNSGAEVYLLAEIGPLKNAFGRGQHGINWPEDLAKAHVDHIIEQLENAVYLAKSQNIPLINAYEASKIDFRYGNRVYVNADDGIHPSVEGHVLMANLIANSLKLE